jgi:anti-sigma factor RsiW
MLRCRDIVDLLGEYLDGALDRETVRALEAHLAGCQDCTAFINTYRGTVRSSRALSEDQLPRELKERLLTFLRRQTRP